MKQREVGAIFKDDRCRFVVWAPFAGQVYVEITSKKGDMHLLKKDADGYWETELNDIAPGARYRFVIDEAVKRPDPAARSQPEGVHGPSEVIDTVRFNWEDEGWKNISLSDMIIYELHVGTFSDEGTFEGVIGKLDYLKDLGVNAIELMPVAQFPGDRNWGYDGVYPFAVQDSYGGAKGLMELVNACHHKGIAVLLDVVYNHMGPEGNYLADFGPYFTDKYSTPWGKAINFDDAYSDEVRNYFIQNALMWFQDFHIDGLRLDAVHAITDMSAYPFLKELSESVKTLSRQNERPYYLVAESDLNDTRIIRSFEEGGYELHGQWSDEFHHAVHALATGEKYGYYQDFGGPEQLKKALEQTFVYNHVYSSFRKKTFGNDATDIPASKFVVFSQNHDQTGNRMLGERMSQLVSFEALKLIAGTVFVSPYIPLLFMGEEYGEQQPFIYFVSHTDDDLVEAVRAGRKREFEAFRWKGEPPDPQDIATFNTSKLTWNHKNSEQSKRLHTFYKSLIALKKEHPVLSTKSKEGMKVNGSQDSLLFVIERQVNEQSVLCLLNFNKVDTDMMLKQEGRWNKLLDSSDTTWNGPGSVASQTVNAGDTLSLCPESITIYEKEIKK